MTKANKDFLKDCLITLAIVAALVLVALLLSCSKPKEILDTDTTVIVEQDSMTKKIEEELEYYTDTSKTKIEIAMEKDTQGAEVYNKAVMLVSEAYEFESWYIRERFLPAIETMDVDRAIEILQMLKRVENDSLIDSVIKGEIK